MKIKYMVIIGIFIFVLIFYFCQNIIKSRLLKPKNDTQLQKITLALDWTPNTNHTGIYAAIANNYYSEQNIKVEILPYSQAVSVDNLISSGKADTGISFTESILTSKAAGLDVISIAAVLYHNTSSIAVLSDSTYKSPKDLSGKKYGGFGSIYEEPVLNQMIKNSEGKPGFANITLDTDGISALSAKKIDFIWIFEGWQRISAKLSGINLRTFPLRDYGIPDYYTPNIITSKKFAEKNPDILKRFMLATSKGYEFAANNSTAAAQIFIKNVGKEVYNDERLVYQSQDFVSRHYIKPGEKWGYQELKMWTDYPKFIIQAKGVKDNEGKIIDAFDYASLYTNDFLP